MSNLIPTPRADKNGKVVTRHIKNQPATSTPVNIPAPQGRRLPSDAVKQKWLNDKASTNVGRGGSGNIFSRWKRKKAITSLTDVLFPNKSDVIWGTSASNLGLAVNRTLTTEEILLARDIAQLVNRSDVPRKNAEADNKRILWLLREQADIERTPVRVRAFHAHRDWLESHPGEADKLLTTVEKLIELDMIKDGGKNGIDHLNEYMAGINHHAFKEYDIIHIWRKDYLSAVLRHPDQIDNIVSYFKAGDGFKEDGFEDYLRSAGKHHDKIDRMADYIEERGSFDEDGFEEYLNAATPLADGAL